MAASLMRFGFGKNWERFIRKHFSADRVERSRKSLLAFLDMPDLKGKSFLDIGCGSGLHSLAALRSGAASVVSFDFDLNSVNATRKVRQFAGNPSHWSVLQGSVLDPVFLRTMNRADIVYSWGVLHHTGAMWEAIANASGLMKDNGLFYIALYQDRPYFDRPISFWIEIKQRYNREGWMAKRRLEFWYFWEFYLQRKWKNLPAFVRQARDYKLRGMEMYTDAVDWLGGWPFEVATVDEVERFASEKLGLTARKVLTEQANAEFLFSR